MRKHAERLLRFMIPFFAAFMLMSLIAYAADDHQGWKRVTSVSDLAHASGSEYIISPGNYYLDHYISLDKYLVVETGSVTICLHDHTLEANTALFTVIVRGGASLTIESCGSGGGVLLNSRDSVSAETVYVAGGGSFIMAGGEVRCDYGDALDIAKGTASVWGGVVQGDRNGVRMKGGKLTVKGGEVWGKHQYGVEINSTALTVAEINIQGGLVTGLGGGIYTTETGSGQVNVSVEDGEVVASLGSIECIYLKPGSGSAVIEGGRFFGTFNPGMNVIARGGLYCNDSIKEYVAPGYICREHTDNTYAYEVDKKRSYTVTFTDGAGKSLKTQTVLEGDDASAPPDPARTGFVFDGWDRGFVNLSGTTEKITVNAKWKAAGTEGGSGAGSPGGSGETGAVYSGTDSGASKTVTDLKKVAGLRLKKGKQKITVRWTRPSAKVLKTISGYEIQYGRKKNFSDAKKVRVKKTGTRLVLKKLKKNKKYYVRIRAYKGGGSALHVSKWTMKSVKTR